MHASKACIPTHTDPLATADEPDSVSHASGSLGLKFRRRETAQATGGSPRSQRHARLSVDGSAAPVSHNGNRGRSVSTVVHGHQEVAVLRHTAELPNAQETPLPYTASNISITVVNAPDRYDEPAAVQTDTSLLSPDLGGEESRNAVSLDTSVASSTKSLDTVAYVSPITTDGTAGYYNRAKMQAAMQALTTGQTSSSNQTARV